MEYNPCARWPPSFTLTTATAVFAKSPSSDAGPATSPHSNHLADVSSELLRGEEDFALGQPDLTESVFQKASFV